MNTLVDSQVVNMYALRFFAEGLNYEAISYCLQLEFKISKKEIDSVLKDLKISFK